MKLTLEFNTDDPDERRRAIQATRNDADHWQSIARDFDDALRGCIKYETFGETKLTRAQIKLADELRQFLRALITDEGLCIDGEET